MSSPNPSLEGLRIHRKPVATGSRAWLAVGIILLIVIGAGLAWWLRQPKALIVKTAAAREVSSGQSGERTVLNASGYVVARREATVSSKVTGKVIEVLIEEGMKVAEGQILARLDDTNVKASFRLAEAQLVSARAALDETRVGIRQAEIDLRRVADLARTKIASDSDLDKAQAAADGLKARLVQQEAGVKVAETELAAWQQQLDDTIIRAPFAGIVTSKNAQPGEMISPISAGGGFTRTGICTIVDMDSLEIEIDVSESYINRVVAAQPVEASLDAYSEWKIPCKVIAIIPTADRQKSTVRVRVGFDKLDPRILPQMSVKVAFRETTASGAANGRQTLVPKVALSQDGSVDIVYVVTNGRADRRAVKVGGTRGEEVELLSGLSAGEKVITNRPAGLKDGASVKEAAQ
jgi:RND family efflux transporter MFP subunit